jgi:lipid II:glycine glycyltransferase (peptidoglycan interpeptide bridge formation enzyme)
MDTDEKQNTARDKYRALCAAESTILVFSQDWYLDAVCGADRWDVALVERDGGICAALPYYVRLKVGGLRVLGCPPLTQCLGPWLKYPEEQKYASRLSFEKEMYTALIDNLPPFAYFSQHFHVGVRNWLPFYWRGFEQTTRYTYRLDLTPSPEELMATFKSNARGKIRKAAKCVTVRCDLGAERFYEVNKLTFERQGLEIPYDLELFQSADQALASKDRRRMFFAIDDEQHVHSALYLIWDAEAAYVHLVGESPEYRASGAGILLIWEAIAYVRDTLRLRWFDFEGSMIESVESVRRECGGIQTPYFRITKVNSRLLKVAMAMRRMVA